MEINDWWQGDASERFWMEITDRGDLGADLFAPTTQQGGKPYWGYELVTHVAPGDVVLHWHKSLLAEPGLVGWSVATGRYEDTEIGWQARGSVGRAKGSLRPRPAWRMPLQGYVALQKPLLITSVRRHETQLREAKAALQSEHQTESLYFPFGFSDKRSVRAQQTYLVKLPARVLDIFDLTGIVQGESEPPAYAARPRKPTKARGSGYMADALVRTAIEWRAVDAATTWYESEGFDTQYVGNTKPYDLVGFRGGEELRIEVKGSSGAADRVELTSGEVDNARSTINADLFVLDGVRFERNPDGTVEAFGGEARVWRNWTPRDAALKVTRYRYALPSGATSLGFVD